MIILVRVAADRDVAGLLSVEDITGKMIAGPFPVAARASYRLACAHGNSGRDPKFRFGDTPLGSYRLLGHFSTGRGKGFPAREFGPHGMLVLEPRSGDAALAEANGRFRLAIAGGTQAHGLLRPTAGGLRLSNEHMRQVVVALKDRREVRCVIEESRDLPDAQPLSRVEPGELADPVRLSSALRASAATRSDARHLQFTRALVVATSFAAVHAANAAPTADLSVLRTMEQTFPGTSISPQASTPTTARPYVRIAYDSPQPASPTFISAPATAAAEAGDTSFLSNESGELLGGTPPSPTTLAAQIDEIWTGPEGQKAIRDEALKQYVTDPLAANTIEYIKDAAKQVAAETPDAEKGLYGYITGADAEMLPLSSSLSISAISGIANNAFKLKEAYNLYETSANAIDDYNNGKIGVDQLVAKLGPVPAKALLTRFNVPFADQIVDSTVTIGQRALGPAIDKTIDAGFYIYDKAKGYR